MSPFIRRFHEAFPALGRWFLLVPLALASSCADPRSTPECEVGLSLCEGECVDSASDARHCGGCDNACPGSQVCRAGGCTELERGNGGGSGGAGGVACDDGLTDCGGRCVDLDREADHCGACGAACLPNQTCAGGECACTEGLSECGGACYDLQSSMSNCGVCGRSCFEWPVSNMECQRGECTCLLGDYTDLGSTAPQTAAGDTAGGAVRLNMNCTRIGRAGQTFLFTAPEAATYTVSAQGDGYDPAVGLFDARRCDELACVRDEWGAPSRASAVLEEGDRLGIVITNPDADRGAFTLQISGPRPPACPTGAFSAALPSTVTGDSGAFGDTITPSCKYPGNPDASYTFVAPHDGRYRFDTAGSSRGVALEVRDGACDGQPLACSDSYSLAEPARALVDIAEGHTAVAVVESVGTGTSGPYRLNVSEVATPPCRPVDLGTAVPQTVTGTTVGLPDVLSPSCGNATSGDAVYRFTAPEDGVYLFDTLGSSLNTTLDVRDGACFAPSLDCDDDADGVQQSKVDAELTAGQPVTVLVSSPSPLAGDFALHIRRFTGAGTCSTPIDLGSTVPQTVAGDTAPQPDSAPNCLHPSSTYHIADVIYTFTAPADGTYVVSVLSEDAVFLAVRDGSCDGALLQCHANVLTTTATVALTAGQTIAVAVEGQGPPVEFSLEVRNE
jgi:hypothetical protein